MYTLNLCLKLHLHKLYNNGFVFFFYLDIEMNDQDSAVEVEDKEVIDHMSKIGYYNSTENPTAPKFTKLDNMHRTVAKPAGNMVKLKCAAEGKFFVQHQL